MESWKSKGPRPSGRGLLEHLSRLRLTRLGLMKPAILLEHVGGYFLANRACTISLLPTLPTPSLRAHLGKSRPTLPGTDRLQQPHHLPNRVLRRNAQKHMHGVFLYVQLFDLKPVMRRSLQK